MDAAQRIAVPGFDVRILSLGLLAGATASLLAPAPALAWLPGLPLLLLPVSLWLRAAARVFVLAALVGALGAGLQAQQWLQQRWPVSRHGEIHSVPAIVDAIPDGRGTRLRLQLRSLSPEYPPRIRADWYDAPPEAEDLMAGDCRHWRLRLKTPSGRLNPGGFDYEGWLFREGIGATASVLAAAPCASDDSVWRLDRWRQRLSWRLQERLGDTPAAAVLRALVIGDRSGIDDTQWQVFRYTGTSHLMAISGLHVGVVAAAAGFLALLLAHLLPGLAGRVPLPMLAAGASVLAAAAYAALAGFALPTLRALCMLSAAVLAWLSGRLPSPSAVLATAVIPVWLLDPLASLRPGFWMSFAAVAVILWVVASGSGRWRLLKIQLALGLGLLPLSLWFFDGVSAAGLAVNLVAVPLMALLLPLLLLGAGLVLLWPGASAPVAAMLMVPLDAGLRALAQVAQQSSAWFAASPGAAECALLALGVVLLAGWRLRLWPLALLCLAAVAVPPAPVPDGAARLTVLDVGQGTAVVVETAGGTLLYDAGPAWPGGFDSGRMVIEPFLRHRGIRRLDRVLLSHGDRDHAGGAASLHQDGWIREAPAALTGCRAGQHWRWGRVQFRTLHPDSPHWRGNDASCVLRVAGDGWSVLLPGDIGRKAEAALVASGADLRADVLLSPHHGSRSSSSAAFVQAVSPALVIHSAGWRHVFGHPHPGVVDRYARAGAEQYVTGRDGALSLELGPGVRQLRWARAQSPRLWRRPGGPEPSPGQPGPASTAARRSVGPGGGAGAG